VCGWAAPNTDTTLAKAVSVSVRMSMGVVASQMASMRITEGLGVPSDIGLRHGLSHFQHIFCTSSYAAGYYVYMWAKVLEADGFEAFTETGDPFDFTTAQRLLHTIYSTGNTLEPAEAYRAFRGRDPVVEPLLRKLGLLRTSA
jgi:peptidyl-dipeptidase Dcp